MEKQKLFKNFALELFEKGENARFVYLGQHETPQPEVETLDQIKLEPPVVCHPDVANSTSTEVRLICEAAAVPLKAAEKAATSDKIAAAWENKTISKDHEMALGSRWQVNVKTLLNARDANGEVVGKMKNGELVTIVNTKVYEVAGRNFVKINYRGEDYFVARDYLQPPDAAHPAPERVAFKGPLVPRRSSEVGLGSLVKLKEDITTDTSKGRMTIPKGTFVKVQGESGSPQYEGNVVTSDGKEFWIKPTQIAIIDADKAASAQQEFASTVTADLGEKHPVGEFRLSKNNSDIIPDRFCENNHFAVLRNGKIAIQIESTGGGTKKEGTMEYKTKREIDGDGIIGIVAHNGNDKYFVQTEDGLVGVISKEDLRGNVVSKRVLSNGTNETFESLVSRAKDQRAETHKIS